MPQPYLAVVCYWGSVCTAFGQAFAGRTTPAPGGLSPVWLPTLGRPTAGGLYITNTTDVTISSVGWVNGANIRLTSGAGTDQFTTVEGEPTGCCQT